MMLESLIFNKENTFNSANLVRIGDLSYFEGPLLSLFEELTTGHFYLFDWVDRDMKHNRWLIYRVLPKYLLQFINGKISHLELFNKRPTNNVFLIDIDLQNKPFNYYNARELATIPEDYYPSRDNFFDISDCNAFEKIKMVIINSLSRQKVENEYSKTLKITDRKAILNKKYFNKLILLNMPTIRNTNVIVVKVSQKSNLMNDLKYSGRQFFIGHKNQLEKRNRICK